MPALTRSFATRPLRLAAATLLLALAGGIALTVQAAPQQHRGGGPGMMMLAPGHVERMLDLVNATAEQRTQIQAIATAAQADLKAQREAGRALHEQSLQLFMQPTVDARAAESLRQQMLAQHDAASKRMLQAMLDTSRVLTPEQRQTLGQKMAEMRARHAEHGGSATK
jgi:periplasmic protein CpxP/Spy